MKRNSLTLTVVGCCVVTAMLAIVTGCGDSEEDKAQGTGIIQGTVESFGASAVVGRILAAAVGVTVYLDGPVSRSTTTAANGHFSFVGLPAGSYTLRFEYNGEEVTYRGQSGQTATISVTENQTVDVTDIRISGGHVNIGNIRITDGCASANLSGVWNCHSSGFTFVMALSQNCNAVSGTFTLTVTCGASCQFDYGCGAPGDECTGSVNGTLEGNNFHAVLGPDQEGDSDAVDAVVDGNAINGSISGYNFSGTKQ